MRRIDGITSSRIEKVLNNAKDHPVVAFVAISLATIAIFFMVWVVSFTVNNPTPIQPRETQNTASKTLVNNLVNQPEPTAKKVVGIPLRIQLPSINVDATIEQVGTTRSGAMGVPSKTNEVGWYQDGYKPGENGNAVITGHVDTILLRPAVFANLGSLKTGDKIMVTDSADNILSFTIERTETFKVGALPISNLFALSDKSHLNLITCSGKWSWKIASYTERTVVYSTLQN